MQVSFWKEKKPNHRNTSQIESSECEPDKSTADIFDSGSDGSYIDDLDNDFVPTSDLDEVDVSLYSVYTQYYKVD
jgi:hypothetical protein